MQKWAKANIKYFSITFAWVFIFSACKPTVHHPVSAATTSSTETVTIAPTPTPTPVPPNPTGLTATVDSSTQITLDWVSGGGSTSGYKIAYRTGAVNPVDCQSNTTIDEGSISGTSHPVSGLSSGTQYSFRVCAINANGVPDVSGGVTISATTFLAPPPNPSGLTATANSASQITLSWTTGGGTTSGYKIAYLEGAVDPVDCQSDTVISAGSITGTSHPVTGLTSGTQYSFRVCAINANTSPDVSGGVTNTATTFLDAPPDPTNLITTANSTSQITLSWNSGGGSTSDYQIAYVLGNTAPADCASETTIGEGAITGTSKVVTGLSAGTQYSFRVCAINSNGTPDVSSGTIETLYTLFGSPPNPTQLASTNKSLSSITLSWLSGGGTTTGYKISYRAGIVSPVDCQTNTIISSGSITGTSHPVVGLDPGIQYSFRVCAINSDLTPAVSSGVIMTDSPVVPTIPIANTLLGGLYHNGLWSATGLDVLRINSATLRADEAISGVVNYNGEPCWIGVSANQFQGKAVWCRASGVKVEISNTNTSGDDRPANLTAIGTSLYFSAFNGIGNKVYQWDGTVVSQISNTKPGGDDYPSSLAAVGSDLYFVADNDSEPTHAYQTFKVFKWNGAAVSQISDTTSAGSDDSPSSLTAVGTDLYFSAYTSGYLNKLHKWDGISVSVIANDPNSDDYPVYLTSIGSDLYFVAADSNYFYKLFKWNGTVVTQISDINVGTSDIITELAALGSDLYFSLTTVGDGFQEVYKWNGTAVARAFDINVGANDSASNLKTLGTDLYFSAVNGSGYSKTFKWNGTSVSQVSDIFPGGNDWPQNFVLIGTDVYFNAQNSSGSIHLYDWNGTNFLQVSGATGSGNDNVSKLTALGSKLYFVATVPYNKKKLFEWDGTSVVQISNTNPGDDDNPQSLTVVGTDLYFLATIGGGVWKLYKFNGTAISQTTASFSNNYTPSPLTVVGSDLYFSSLGAAGGSKLHKWNGTALTEISNTNPGSSDSPSEIIAVGSDIYFTAQVSTVGWPLPTKLFKWDGTVVTQISDINPGGNDRPLRLMAAGSDVYFLARNTAGKNKLFRWNGTIVSEISNTNAGGNDEAIARAAIGTDVYFTSYYTGGAARFLYKWDGTSVSRISDLANVLENDVNATGSIAVVMGTDLYWAASPGFSIFKWDGAAVSQVTDTNVLYMPAELKVIGSNLYFGAVSVSAGGTRKLFKWDGAAVSLVSDEILGGGDTPTGITGLGSSIYFIGTDGLFDRIFKLTP